MRGITLGVMSQQNAIYGVEWDVTQATTQMTRVGNLSLHRWDRLPVHNLMKRCLLLDDGTVNYYLDPNDSTKKEDGTPSILDGTDGQLMVEIPLHYRRFDTAGNMRRASVSLHWFTGSHVVPKCYVSAFEAAVYRPDNKLSSVINKSTDYRGGNNNNSNDGNEASLLGMPATAISRINFTNYARNRGNGWNCYLYEVHKTIFWLYMVEYANKNSQLAFNATPDSDGLRQGGLGVGLTNLSSANWSDFNGQYPLAQCGSGSMSNHTDVTTILHSLGSLQVTNYRGIEHPFGHLWKWTEGLNFQVVDGQQIAWKANSYDFSGSGYDDYTMLGNMTNSNGYIQDWIFGSDGDIVAASSSGASSTTYWADYYYCNVASNGIRGLRLGGASSSGSAAGLGCSASSYAPSSTLAHSGSRLCFVPAGA